MNVKLESAFEENDTVRYLTEQASQFCHIQNINNGRYVMEQELSWRQRKEVHNYVCL
jgi:hypothetical protein